MVAITYAVTFMFLVWWSAWSVNRIDELRRQAEEAKKLSEVNYGITLASIGDAVIATDERGKNYHDEQGSGNAYGMEPAGGRFQTYP